MNIQQSATAVLVEKHDYTGRGASKYYYGKFYIEDIGIVNVELAKEDYDTLHLGSKRTFIILHPLHDKITASKRTPTDSVLR